MVIKLGPNDKKICKVCGSCTLRNKANTLYLETNPSQTRVACYGNNSDANRATDKEYIPFDLSLAVKYTGRMKEETHRSIMKIFIKRALEKTGK